ATKYVATHRPDTLSWQNSQWLGDDVVATLRQLKQEDGPDLLIQGSSELIQTLLANDLIDEVSLLIFPLVLGKGKRLFGGGAIPAAFKLNRSQASSTGVIIASYERAGEIKTGSFAQQQPSEAEIERRRTWK
ncbi:MAG: dihydrofolate reductase, partial [Mesorhizobium sp.]